MFDNQIVGRVKNITALYQEVGYTEMVAPSYLTRTHINAYVTIDYKEGKYRVTVKDMICVWDSVEKSSMEDYAVSKGSTEVKPSFKKSASDILDYTLTKIFEF